MYLFSCLSIVKIIKIIHSETAQRLQPGLLQIVRLLVLTTAGSAKLLTPTNGTDIKTSFNLL